MKAVLLKDYDVDTEQQWLHSAAKEETPLHTILRYQPSADVVRVLISKLIIATSNDVPEEVEDANGKTALHIAAANGCDVSVVRLLLCGVSDIMPVFSRDAEGQLPLHAACDPVTRNRNQRQVDNMANVVFVLLLANPMASVIRDCRGEHPWTWHEKIKQIVESLTL